ncbi:MAG: dTDP-4-dehydrorhamnose 3,5-epimerase [Candidatus Sericytochromatia bacterium]|nr:dTDP-4-dehydrorhamnose 3,5-epimerase [Candidatus Sericytochromatia bacterium]
MKLTTTRHPEVFIVEATRYEDARGFFQETFHAGRFAQAGLPTHFVQDNRSRSHGGVLRGLHYQLHQPQGKLIRVEQGRIYDVAADVRRNSPHYGVWVGVELSAEDDRQIWIPPGFAHGFLVLTDRADVSYKCTALYDPPSERGIRWNDPTLAIDWPACHYTRMVSSKDEALPSLTEQHDLPVFYPSPTMTGDSACASW